MITIIQKTRTAHVNRRTDCSPPALRDAASRNIKNQFRTETDFFPFSCGVTISSSRSRMRFCMKSKQSVIAYAVDRSITPRDRCVCGNDIVRDQNVVERISTARPNENKTCSDVIVSLNAIRQHHAVWYIIFFNNIITAFSFRFWMSRIMATPPSLFRGQQFI